MKKSTAISIGLIIIGFILECLYLNSSNIFFKAKLWLVGVICIIAGILGLVLFTILAEKNDA